MIKVTFTALFFSIVLMFPNATFAQQEPKIWKGHIFGGYSSTNGNTKNSSGNLEAEAVKNFEDANLTLRANLTYAESNGSMDSQKWDALAKYAFDFGKDNKYFNFYQLFVDHDYFADIDYRLTPAAGLGYHISKTEDWTWDVDLGFGYRITKYRSSGSSDSAPTALIHTFMKKNIFEKSFLSEDVTVYPGLKSDAGVIVKSETAFTNPISEKLDLQLKYIIDLNTEPGAGKKKTDTQIIAGVRYKF